jgi:hypothetical protein
MIDNQRELCVSHSFGMFNIHIYTPTNRVIKKRGGGVLRLTGSKLLSNMMQNARDNEVIQLW